MNTKKDTIGTALTALTCVAMLVSLYMAFLYAPREATMGDVQRIFYFHVPSAWLAFFAFFLVFVFSFAYLLRGGRRWDTLAAASAEIGVLFCTLVLVTGPIWARPVWGAWWTWDTRLTTTLVLWLIYVAYLMVRSFASDESRAARFGAVIGIAGFLDVPIVALAIQLWRTQHPGPAIFTGGLEPRMVLALVVCIVAFTFLFLYLAAFVANLRDMKRRVRDLEQTRDLEKE